MDKKKIERILQGFSYYLNCEVTTVEIDGVTKKATLEDQIDFIKTCWEKTSVELFDLGVETNY